jgi:beta-galactosidase
MKTHRFARFALFTTMAGWCFGALAADPAANNRDRSFDSGWRFLRADAPGAEATGFDDTAWRTLDVPHDWSIEDLPPLEKSPVPELPVTTGQRHFQKVFDGTGDGGLYEAGMKSVRVGPFDPGQSEGGASTGHVLGGTGWYRKHFTLTPAESNKLVAVRFDGVYMDADFWINGRHLGKHPYGYTSFEFDLTPCLRPVGQENVIAVRVRNEGKNSRWYSGSGIYRHAWLTVTAPIHVPTWGVFVTTPQVSKEKAVVKIASEVRNGTDAQAGVVVRARLLDANGKALQTAETRLRLPANGTRTVEQTMEVRSPKLWSPESPALYSAEIAIAAPGNALDITSTRFGIRKIEVDAEKGFRLNGQMLKLKGGCMHHDNGPLGAAAIDRAEERRVELLKANGFNAIRTSHNPPSPAFLDACDRLGILVIDEAFDCWQEGKNGQDYHLYFKDWAERDITSMVRRDRNHPSIVIWSIGNEIPEQFRAEATAKMLRELVLSHDATRPITQAVCSDWGNVSRNWVQLSDVAFNHLDIGGYNYLPDKYESDHARNPKRVMMATESFPKDLFDYWSLVEKHPYIIGDFVWTAMDYFGESGIGHSTLSNKKDSFLLSWPWFDAWCGDLDVCGFKKPQSYYRDVVWRRSPIEIAVHTPMPAGVSERVSGWGWPDETRSWNWPGQEGKTLQVAAYSRCESVRLELNGKVVGEKPVSAATKLTARFDVPYQPGELRAIGLSGGKPVASASLRTADEPKEIRLTADRATIRTDRNDLSYVTVEIVDRHGALVPNAEVPIRFIVTGAGELAATGSTAPNDASGFHVPTRATCRGRCMAILRPQSGPGQITLKAEADGLKPATIVVRTR